MDQLRREVSEVIEQRPPYTLADVQHTIGAVLSTMKAIENRLAAIQETRKRLSRTSGRPDGAAQGTRAS